MKCKCIRPWMSAHICPEEISVCCQQITASVKVNSRSNLQDVMLNEYRDFRIAMLESSEEDKLPEQYCNKYCSMKLDPNTIGDTDYKRQIEEGNVDFFIPLDITMVTDYNCNLKCKMCYIFDEINIENKMPEHLVISTIDSMKERSDSKIVILGGEPQYSKYAKTITKYVIESGVKLAIVSNFSIFDEETFNLIKNNEMHWSSISANSASNTTRKLIMGDSFDRFISNVEKFLQWRHNYQKTNWKFEVRVSFVIMHSNYHEIIDAIDFYLQYPLMLHFMSYNNTDSFKGCYEDLYRLKKVQEPVKKMLTDAINHVDQIVENGDFEDTVIPCQFNIEEFRMRQLDEIKNTLVSNLNELENIIENETSYDEPLFDIEIKNNNSYKIAPKE